VNIVARLSRIKKCRLVSLVYRTKKSDELSVYLIALGVDLRRAYARDEKVIRLIKTRGRVQTQAKQEILDSLRESLRYGLGNNSRYTCRGVYKTLFNGCKIHRRDKTIHFYGFIIRKKILEEGSYPLVRHSALTLAKMKIRKHMKINRFRQFELSHVKKIAFEGKVLTFSQF